MSDFTNIADIGGTFSATELDAGVDFVNTGDLGVITIVGVGFGEGGFGQGPFGGGTSLMISGGVTIWININTP